MIETVNLIFFLIIMLKVWCFLCMKKWQSRCNIYKKISNIVIFENISCDMSDLYKLLENHVFCSKRLKTSLKLYLLFLCLIFDNYKDRWRSLESNCLNNFFAEE